MKRDSYRFGVHSTTATGNPFDEELDTVEIIRIDKYFSIKEADQTRSTTRERNSSRSDVCNMRVSNARNDLRRTFVRGRLLRYL